MKQKINIYKPKTVKESIRMLETFLEVDLYSKFRPETKIKGEKWYRTDYFRNEKQFIQYIRIHFDMLEKEIKKLMRKK